MRRVKYGQVYAGPRGGTFSEWFVLAHVGGVHRMACCDCGLVHRIQFGAWRKLRKKGKHVGYKPKSPREYAVACRVALAPRATAGRRRASKHKEIRIAIKRRNARLTKTKARR